MKGHVVKEDKPVIICDEDGYPIIMTGIPDHLKPKEHTPPPLTAEEEKERLAREVALNAKLWSKARRPGPPRQQDGNPIFWMGGTYIQEEDFHEPAKWFAKLGETQQGAWLHKMTDYTEYGQQFSLEGADVVGNDQTVMRIMRNYTSPSGPTPEQRDEALSLHKKEEAERREFERKRKEAKKRKHQAGDFDDTEMGGMRPSRTMAGVDVPLGWNEENGEMGSAQAVEEDFQREQHRTLYSREDELDENIPGEQHKR
jgi:hypothetical protein